MTIGYYHPYKREEASRRFIDILRQGMTVVLLVCVFLEYLVVYIDPLPFVHIVIRIQLAKEDSKSLLIFSG